MELIYIQLDTFGSLSCIIIISIASLEALVVPILLGLVLYFAEYQVFVSYQPFLFPCSLASYP